MRQVDLTHRGAELLHGLDGTVHGRHNVRVGVLEVIGARHTEPDALQVALEGGVIVWHRLHSRTGITPVGAGYGLQHQGRVSDSARHGPGMVQTPAQGDDTGTTDTAVGRLEPNNAAERCRVTYRAASVAASGERHHMRRQSGARARARPAWKHRRIPWIARRPKHFHTAGGKFDSVEFAEADGTSPPQARRHGRILGSDVAGHHFGRRRGGHALHVVNILVGHRDAVQRTAIAAAADLDLSRLRRGQGMLGTDVKVGDQIAIQRVNTLQQRVYNLHWRELARPQQWSKFSHIQKTQFGIGHDRSPLFWPGMLCKATLSYHRIQPPLEWCTISSEDLLSPLTWGEGAQDIATNTRNSIWRR